MEPYFKTDRGALYKGDCLEVMAQLYEKFNLCLTDPPFAFTGGISNGVSALTDSQFFSYWFNDVAQKIIALMNPLGCIFSWCDWRTVNIINEAFIKASDPYKTWLVSQVIYQNRKMVGMGKPFRNQIDSIALIRGTKTDFKNRIPNNTPNIFDHYSYYGKHEFHPAQKLVEVAQKFIEWGSDENERVLDPFLGSGTTAIACENLNRRWVGIEKEERYCEIAAKRIEAAASQRSFEDYF